MSKSRENHTAKSHNASKNSSLKETQIDSTQPFKEGAEKVATDAIDIIDDTKNFEKGVEKDVKKVDSSEKTPPPSVKDSKAQKEPVKKGNESSAPKKPSFFSRFKGIFLWFIIFAAIAAAVVFTRQDLDWQVQHINDLQTKVVQLQQNNQALEARLETQLEAMNARLDKAAKEQSMRQPLAQSKNLATSKTTTQPIITQADLDKIQQTSQEQLARLQEKLMVFSQQASQQVNQAVSHASEIIATTENVLQPSDKTLEALAQVEQKIQTQLSDVGNQLIELFDFKSAQQAVQQAAQQTVLAESKQDQTAKNLSQEQLQQWALETNTQWLLRGNVAESQGQLQALQQATTLSKAPNAITLASFIGQDLAYLEAFNVKEKTDQLNTDALKQAIKTLIPPNLATSQALKTAEKEGGGGIINTQEGLSFGSAMEQLKQTLGGMVSVKKRDEENQITQVESLILQDVLVQRALLLVDRMDWAIISQSNALLVASAQDLQTYIEQTFKDDSAKFKALLTPFTAHSFELRKPLEVRNYPLES